MKILDIIEEMSHEDPELPERLDTRRSAMSRFAGLGGKLALAALPLALGGLLKKAYGQTTSSIVDILNYALTLEYLESTFYTTGAASGVVPAGTPAVAAINTIRDHENEHVAFLTSVIKSMNATPVTKPNFDFTAGGTFPNVFTNYDTFLAVAQAFEDTGVRAYKGRAVELMSNSVVLTAALQIHSVEARHASHIRQMRAARGANEKPWITGNDTGGIGPAVQSSYNGEENTIQGGVNITNFVNINAATESFDEPLTASQVLAIVKPFIV
ncbi:ferritin-like domain-containing protein [Chitinophaga sp. Cy-1792]|uniref:ferritin-like domain-containing protein n=1 Tax=Chitinophaga sp. Cy-1792 TaxID=2608339 RepID=UPI00141F1AEE|nr:ferritin-like domain-containing protein [Chitinophaga sp. Cy-1792]NIG55931.1 ferritin-like domain-containing protein [Chitinophaga sp. Cy-1792]